MSINPNPRLVSLLNYALDEVAARLRHQDEFRDWLDWAAEWKGGQRSPQACVDISHRCGERVRKNSLRRASAL